MLGKIGTWGFKASADKNTTGALINRIGFGGMLSLYCNYSKGLLRPLHYTGLDGTMRTAVCTVEAY